MSLKESCQLKHQYLQEENQPQSRKSEMNKKLNLKIFRIKQVKSCEFQGVQEAIKREPGFENGNFDSRTVENTPRGFENERYEQMKGK